MRLRVRIQAPTLVVTHGCTCCTAAAARHCPMMDCLEILPGAEAALEVLDAPQAAQLARCQDADAAAQRLALLHAMRGHDHCVPCTHICPISQYPHIPHSYCVPGRRQCACIQRPAFLHAVGLQDEDVPYTVYSGSPHTYTSVLRDSCTVQRLLRGIWYGLDVQLLFAWTGIADHKDNVKHLSRGAWEDFPE